MNPPIHVVRLGLTWLLAPALLSGCRPAGGPRIAVLPSGCDASGSVTYTYFVKASDDFPYEYGIYLPPCYDPLATYPLLYLIPGAGGGRRDWFDAGAAAVADDLILTGEVPPFIIVTTMDVGSALDAPLVTGELMPYVDAAYPVSRDRRYRAVAGYSAGEIAAYHIGLQDPGSQASVGIFGMGLVPDETDRVRAWLTAIPADARPRFYLNSCLSDQLHTVGMARDMLGLLDEAGLSHEHVFNPGAHDFACWGASLPDFFHWLARGWRAADRAP